MRQSSIFAWLVLSVAVTACENRKAEAASTSAAVVATASSVTPSPASKDSTAKVAKIVFVGKEHACDCTRKKVDAALAVLQKFLGIPPKIAVEMLKVDTEEEKVTPYRMQKPMVAIPAIYFVDGKGSVVEMLQGEVTEEQLSKVLGVSAPMGGGH